MKKYIVEVNGSEYEVIIKDVSSTGIKEDEGFKEEEKKLNKDSIHIEHNTYKEDKKEREKEGEPSREGLTPVVAPMSGKVLSINVGEGDLVSKGKVLLTIEAMKMETEIVAPISGIITKILVSKGDNCNRQDELVLIKEAGDE